MIVTDDPGVAAIAAERKRQVQQEGYTQEHDDMHDCGELAVCGAIYATPAYLRVMEDGAPKAWPFDCCDWKPTPEDRIRELVKAGALIAAEIGRLMRAKEQEG